LQVIILKCFVKNSIFFGRAGGIGVLAKDRLGKRTETDDNGQEQKTNAWVHEEMTLRKTFSLPVFSQYSQYSQNPGRLAHKQRTGWGTESTKSTGSTVFCAWVHEEMTLRKTFSLPVFSQYSQYSQYSQNPGRIAFFCIFFIYFILSSLILRMM